MNKMHEANRRCWNEQLSAEFERRSDESGLWRRCVEEPDLAFDCEMLEVIREFVADLSGKDVCVIGSGNNHAAFALAALGAKVISIDQSARQLAVAARRADELGLSLEFVEADATDLGDMESEHFDLVCSTNGFFVWIAELNRLFAAVYKILKPGGVYSFYDIHPFQRPWDWEGSEDAPVVAKPYWDTGPIESSSRDCFNFHWTVADLLSALAAAGLTLRRLEETPDKNQDGWDGWYAHSGLPIWLLAAAQKLSVEL